MPLIESTEDWWRAVDDYWPQLVNCIGLFHPGQAVWEQNALDYPITARNAEKAIEGIGIREEIKQKEPNPLFVAVQAKEQRDHDSLWRILQQTWYGAPESVGVHSVAGFGVLCDLCSEAWVFEEQDEC